MNDIEIREIVNDPDIDVLDSDTWESFVFLKSYRESYEHFKESGNLDLAHEFLDALIVYGTERRRISNNPLVQAVMDSAEKTIDDSRRKRKEKAKKKAEWEAKKASEQVNAN